MKQQILLSCALLRPLSAAKEVCAHWTEAFYVAKESFPASAVPPPSSVSELKHILSILLKLQFSGVFIAVKPELHDDKQAKSKQVITCYFDGFYRGPSRGKTRENCFSGHKDLFRPLEYLLLFEKCWFFSMLLGFPPLCEIMLGSGFCWCPCSIEWCYSSCTYRRWVLVVVLRGFFVLFCFSLMLCRERIGQEKEDDRKDCGQCCVIS